MVDEFNASHLDDAMSLVGIKTSCLGIKDDLAHHLLHRLAANAYWPPRMIRDLLSVNSLTIARNRRELRFRLNPVDTTKSARLRFSRSGI